MNTVGTMEFLTRIRLLVASSLEQLGAFAPGESSSGAAVVQAHEDLNSVLEDIDDYAKGIPEIIPKLHSSASADELGVRHPGGGSPS